MDWIATIFILLGYWLAGDKHKSAWLFSIVGSIIWVVYAVDIQLWSLVSVNAIFIILGAINLYKWNKKKKVK